MNKNKIILINIVSIILWFINPWAGIISLAGSQIFLNPGYRSHRLVFVLLIISTVILYQLSLPMPHDLLTTTKHYLKMSTNREFAWAWITKDVLSYTVFNFLNLVFPKWPITFYLLNTMIIFLSLWIIFKRESEFIVDDVLKISILIGLFVGCVDYLDSHHYLRQSSALFLFLLSFYFSGLRRWLIIIVSILWHGSMVLLVPLYFLVFPLNERKKNAAVFTLLLIVAIGISQINFYEWMQTKSVSNDIFKFGFFDRYLTYFTEPRHSIYFKLQQEMGNSLVPIYLVVSLFTIAFGIYANNIKKYYLSAIIVTTIWLVVFQYHVLVFSRIAYVLDALLVIFWILQVQKITKLDHRLVAVLVLFCSIMRIHFFEWPITTKINETYLYLSSPISMIRNFSNWEINQDYHRLRNQ